MSKKRNRKLVGAENIARGLISISGNGNPTPDQFAIIAQAAGLLILDLIAEIQALEALQRAKR